MPGYGLAAAVGMVVAALAWAAWLIAKEIRRD